MSETSRIVMRIEIEIEKLKLVSIPLAARPQSSPVPPPLPHEDRRMWMSAAHSVRGTHVEVRKSERSCTTALPHPVLNVHHEANA